MHNSIDIRMVGETIKQLRLSRNWTQDRLADAAGYSVRNLRRIENGGTVSLDVVNTFAEIFQVSAVDILKGCLLFYPRVPENKKRCCQPSPYGTYSNLLFIHMRAGLSEGERPQGFRNGRCRRTMGGT